MIMKHANDNKRKWSAVQAEITHGDHKSRPKFYCGGVSCMQNPERTLDSDNDNSDFHRKNLEE